MFLISFARAQGSQAALFKNFQVFVVAVTNVTVEVVIVSPLYLLWRHVIVPAIAARMLRPTLRRRVSLIRGESTARIAERTRSTGQSVVKYVLPAQVISFDCWHITD